MHWIIQQHGTRNNKKHNLARLDCLLRGPLDCRFGALDCHFGGLFHFHFWPLDCHFSPDTSTKREPGIPVQSHINRKSFLLLGENFREEDFAPGLFGPEAFEKVPDHSVLAVHSDVLTGRDTRNLI